MLPKRRSLLISGLRPNLSFLYINHERTSLDVFVGFSPTRDCIRLEWFLQERRFAACMGGASAISLCISNAANATEVTCCWQRNLRILPACSWAWHMQRIRAILAIFAKRCCYAASCRIPVVAPDRTRHDAEGRCNRAHVFNSCMCSGAMLLDVEACRTMLL